MPAGETDVFEEDLSESPFGEKNYEETSEDVASNFPAEDDTSAQQPDLSSEDCPAGYTMGVDGQCLAMSTPVECAVDDDCESSCQCSGSSVVCPSAMCVEGICKVIETIVSSCPHGCAEGECSLDSEEDVVSEEDTGNELDVGELPEEDVVEDSSEPVGDTGTEEDIPQVESDVSADQTSSAEQEDDVSSTAEDVEQEETENPPEEIPPEPECTVTNDCTFGELCTAGQCEISGNIICRFNGQCPLPVAVIWYGLNKEKRVSCDSDTDEVFEVTVAELCHWGTTNPSFKYNLTDGVYQWGQGDEVVPQCNHQYSLTPDPQQGDQGKMVVSFSEINCF